MWSKREPGWMQQVKNLNVREIGEGLLDVYRILWLNFEIL
jgi:hypothetical protein